MNDVVKILVTGDVVGRLGRNCLADHVDYLKNKYTFDFIISNVENTTHGNGLSYKHYLRYKNANIDVMTMGNHTFGNKEIYDYIDKAPNLLIPANLTSLDKKFDSHRSYSLFFKGKEIKVINIMGDHSFNSFEKEIYYKYFERIYNENPNAIYIIDFHSEITAEKNLFGYIVDGKASLIYGTHTHVQTADERILPNGCAYISDVGMCGAVDSVIGYDYNSYIKRLYEGTPTVIALKGKAMINGLLVTIDLNTKKALSVKRINEKF